MEKQRPLWSYRTSILQVGRAGSPSAEYRTFLDFDLSSLAASGSKIIRAALKLHPLLAASGARLTHYACLLKDSSWHADELTWQNMRKMSTVRKQAIKKAQGEREVHWDKIMRKARMPHVHVGEVFP